MSAFAPSGNSVTATVNGGGVSPATGTFALTAFTETLKAIKIASESSLSGVPVYISLGAGGVTANTTTSMRVIFKDGEAIIGIVGSPTHIAIAAGTGGTAVFNITSGSLIG